MAEHANRWREGALVWGLLLAIVGLTNPARAEGAGPVTWSAMQRAGRLERGRVVAAGGPDGGEVLVVENAGGKPGAVRIATLDASGISHTTWALLGQVRTRDVAGRAYLETWNHFADGSRFFTRGMANAGPMGSLSGSAEWRPFVLPFFSKAGAAPLDHVELNVVFDGPGTVELGQVELVGFAEGEDPLAPTGAWWTPRHAGLLGGGMGSLVGLLGALVGVLTGAGRARRLVLAAMSGAIAVGAALLIGGITAIGFGQPWYVAFPMLLSGGIAALVMGTMLPVVRKRFEGLDRRRMAAMDA